MSGRPRAWAAQLNRGALGARREDVDLSITLTDRAQLEPTEFQRLAREVAEQGTLGDVLEWGLAQKPVRRIEEIVTQDEYTHDVLVPLGPPLYLAYDVS